jgi:folate-binding protein YgfZ
LGQAPDRGQVLVDADSTRVGFPDGRILVVAPDAAADALQTKLAGEAASVAPEVWRWLGIRAGVPVIGAATQDLFVPQTANWDLLGGVSFQKGCYPGQEIVARTQYLGRLKERMHLFHVDGPPSPPATKIYGAVFGDQACGTVVNAAAAPDGGSDLLAILQLSALDGALRVGSPIGPALAPLPLPYAIPAPVAPNRPKL